MTFGISLLLHVIVVGGLLIEHADDQREHTVCPPASPPILGEPEVRLTTVPPAEQRPADGPALSLAPCLGQVSACQRRTLRGEQRGMRVHGLIAA
ncbi:MAG TPA: hypothetical protein VM513_01060 [Kofleriaceae bacterium]|jgi:hypothetical protein|nr:hypothetical protein [Kofleriaceae bacterium]